MAVPKRKTSPSKRGMRSSNKGLKPLTISYDKTSGEAKLPHRLSLKDGTYNGKQIIKPKVKAELEEEVNS